MSKVKVYSRKIMRLTVATGLFALAIILGFLSLNDGTSLLNDGTSIKTIAQIITRGLAPVLSPDGTKIAFLGIDGIYVVSIENNSSSKLLDIDDVVGGTVQWLTTSTIVFRKQGATSEMFQFGVLDILSGEIYLLSDEVFGGRDINFVLSPSGSKIAFEKSVMVEESGKYQTLIHILDIQSGTVYPLITPISWSCIEPTWSNDETQVLYSCSAPEAGKHPPRQVWRTYLDSGVSEPLSDIVDFRNLSIAPNGKWVVYISGFNTGMPPNLNLYIAPVENGKPNFDMSSKLNLTDRFLFSPGSFFELPPSKVSWSSDSKYIVFSGELRTGNSFETGIWHVRLD